MKFGDWLREERLRRSREERERGGRRYSQGHLAADTQRVDPGCRPIIYQSRVSEWERGEGAPNLRQLLAVCRALGVSRQSEAVGRRLWEDAQVSDSAPAGL